MPGALTAVAVFIANVFGPAAVAPIFLVTTTVVGVKLVSALGKKFFGIRQPDPPKISHQIAVRGTREPRMIVYGETRVGGTVVYANTVSTELRRLLLVVAHTGHEIDSYVGWYVDDRYIDIVDVDDINSSGDGAIEGDTASTGHGLSPQGGNTFCYLRGHLGAAAQTADSAMTTYASTDWTSDHRGRGCAYTVLVADIVADYESVWDGAAPQALSAIIKGKKVYDPRLDSTFTGSVFGSGSGDHRLNDASTWEWSDNPALCLADYLIDDDLGPGWATTRIDYDSVAVAADACDELVDIPTATTEKRFTCNGALQTTDTHATNIGKILSAMAGRLRYYGGQWHVYAGVDPGASAYDFTEADLIGPIVFRKEPERQDRYNAVTGWYFDPERNYKDSPFIAVHDTSLRSARDNGKVLSQELALPMTNSEYMAQRLGFRALYQASFTGVCIIQVGYQGLTCCVGDLVTVTHSELGWEEKEFRVANFKLIDFRGVELTLKEDSADAYDDPEEGEYSTRSAAGVIAFGKTTPPRVRTRAPSAVTETEITAVRTTPDSQGNNTTVISYAYTPVKNGHVMVTVTANAEYTTDAAGDGVVGLQYSAQKDSAYFEGFEHEWFIAGPSTGGPGAVATTYNTPLVYRQRMSVTGGVEVTFKFMAAKWVTDDEVYLRNAVMTIEDIPTA